jgi:hypothetical protein
LALACQDASGATWLSYNDPEWLAKRHGLSGRPETPIGNLTAALDSVAKVAAAG